MAVGGAVASAVVLSEDLMAVDTQASVEMNALWRERLGGKRWAGLESRHREWIAAYLFVAPDALGLAVFVGIPMILALTMGFFDVNGFGQFSFVGLANYRHMLADPVFWQCLHVTLVYVVLLVPCLYVSGLGLALLVQQTNRFNTVMRSMFFAPQMVSLVVIALIWQVMTADKIGLIARIASFVGLGGLSLLGSPHLALYTTLFVTVWFLMGFYMLIFIGGLQDIPKQYYEAAEIDGATRISVVPADHSTVAQADKLFRAAYLAGRRGRGRPGL